jgi:hypothetical protein
MRSRLSLLGLGLVLGATPLAAQAPVTRALTNPEEYAESFDLVGSFRELPNGKLLVVDNGPKALLLVDFQKGEHTQIGRNGQGPGEYQFPGALIPYLGDTTLLVDRASRRMLPITPDGKMGKVVTFPDAIQGFSDPRGADAKGRIFFQASPFNFTAGTNSGPLTMPDSSAIVRWDRATNKADTLGKVKLASTKINTSNTGTTRSMTIMQQPYSGQDEWSVTRDGRVGVVRIGDYHVDWMGDRPASGSPVKYTPVKVGAAEKNAFMANMKDTRGRFAVTSGGAGAANAPRPPEPKAEDFDWPEVKPPFMPRNIYTSPEGELWVQRSRAASDSTPVYDVFNPSGNLAARISLPKGRALVGLGTGTAYATRTDEDGLQWLERYKR